MSCNLSRTTTTTTQTSISLIFSEGCVCVHNFVTEHLVAILRRWVHIIFYSMTMLATKKNKILFTEHVVTILRRWVHLQKKKNGCSLDHTKKKKKKNIHIFRGEQKKRKKENFETLDEREERKT